MNETVAPDEVGDRAGERGNAIVERPGWLGVTCWCQRLYVLVPSGHVRAGRTRSCGRPDCQAPT